MASATHTSDSLLDLKGIYQTYILDSGRRVKVLENVNLSVNHNEVLVLLGPSGSGKSTCLRIMAGLLKPTQGKVLMNGEKLSGTNPNIALVFQSFALLPWLNVADNVALGLKPLKLSEAEVNSRVKKAIDLVGLEGFEEAYPKELSGGMKQRVGFARALVMERPILCLDEPFSALDVLTAEALRKEVLNLWLNKKTITESVILVTHNITEAVSMGSRILVMGTNPGQIRFTIRNDLAYPRDEKTAAFKSLVESIHDVITEAIIPDTPEWIPPALAGSTIESLPKVNLNEVIGLIEMISQEGGRADAFALAHKLMKDSLQILMMAKAAELLELVDTPKNSVVLTDLGRNFVKADINGRKKMIYQSMMQLKLTQLFHQRLSALEELSIGREEAIQAIHEWLPNENPEDVFDTLIQWGRFGEVFGYNDDSKLVYIDRHEDQTAS
ncbi:ATP-binding cassette domain-containing protein [bacterium]|jgi:NitT/TauT family transport system ATP-binding protein|nr:ATP-binding cassette domain-containing protein [bacterium]